MAMNHDRAAELYAAWELLEADWQPQTILGVRELYLFLTSPDHDLTPAQTAKLFSSPKLRETFQALKQQLKIAEMPAVAAASSPGDLQERRFAGGTVWNVPSEGNEHQVIFVAEFDDHSYAPGSLKLIGTDGTTASLRLERPENGIIQMPLDLSKDTDLLIVRLLRDPGSTGVFV